MLIRERSNFWKFVADVVFISLGAALEAFSIKFLLLPNNVIDGGLVGVSLILSHISSSSLFAFFLVTITTPFLLVGYRMLGRNFMLRMGLAILSLVVSNELFDMIPSDFISKNLDSVELMVTGAIVLGVGVGLTLKFGGCVDGTEIVALLVQKSKGISVGTTILFFNFFIYSFAAVVYGEISTGVKSIITYMIASYVMDFVNSGVRDLKMVYIFTNNEKSILESINSTLRIGSTVLNSSSARSGRDGAIIVTAVSKVHIPILKSIIEKEDPKSFLVVLDIAESKNGTTSPVGFVKNSSIV